MVEERPPSVGSRALKLQLTVGFYGLMAGLSLAWGFFRDRPNIWMHPEPLLSLPWWATMPAGAVLGAALGYGISRLSVLAARRTRWAHRLMLEFKALLGGLTTAQVLLVAVLSSVGEEMFFRGVLQPGIGLVLSSLVFGAIHVPASWRMVPWTLQALALGFLLGFLFLLTGDLTTCVLLHFVVNYRNLKIIQTWPEDGERAPGSSPG